MHSRAITTAFVCALATLSMIMVRMASAHRHLHAAILILSFLPSSQGTVAKGTVAQAMVAQGTVAKGTVAQGMVCTPASTRDVV